MPTPARIHVAHALHEVFGEGGRVPDIWDRELGEDAHLAQALLGLCLRRWGRLQAWVKPKLKDPDRGVPLGTRVTLAMGLAQLAWLPGVSDHAAVNEAVELAGNRDLGFVPHKGLVNAILRKAAKDRTALAAELEALPAALDRSSAAERALRAALAPHGAGKHVEGDLEALWARLQRPPRPDFRLLKGEVPEGLVPLPEVPGCLCLEDGAPFPRPWLESAAGMVQDRSSQALLAYQWERPVTRILDACAAPGGKATTLALRHPEADLVALEVHPRRAARLRQTLEQRGLRARVIHADAAEWLERAESDFDLILLDAPCSGSGTLQKHPEWPWLQHEDLPRLTGLQRRLLTAAAERLAPGGLLIYAVCSWLPEECEAHREWLAEARPDLQPAPVWPGRLGTPGEGSEGHSPVFRPNPLHWEGEGFQGFAVTRA
ncbi:transcription antitermination factor NusB [Geothrix sp. PMB-07]|uniref:transcription antitermination factor NusB n=1 Tax=Geothrix sp. PMB-07 TaxID=3068640 RepID=UPI002741A8E2|nr:RsmB/NOP family class I SAM-dependent RNA methyltransferase [Geothrix sp. PMB-07]WLT31694.1 RsmB/NOP family class I SAM-dependent RNA methyltransferase [Geothrix sp. PMB-07]